ncbi:MAG: 50S ribosomal protein L18 [Candidatus Omnitrophica bacterium]|nr:50S ribosomal protein L18 [Candidatus Omnitrophota bacterium]
MEEKHLKRARRHRRIRRHIYGTQTKPRLCVYRSLSNIQAQIVDDMSEKTIISVSTNSKEFRKKHPYGGNVKAAAFLGEILAQQAKDKGISKLVFDRGGFAYHGRVKAFAEAARKAGLEF